MASPNPAASPAAASPAARWPQGHPKRRQILLVLCLSLLVVVIDNTILNTALPTLARELHEPRQRPRRGQRPWFRRSR